HRFLDWPRRPLRSTERVAWRVAAAPEGEWSPWHEFEAGLFDADWTARWISPPEASEQPAGTRPAHVLATTFELSGEVQTARLYATALGLYEVFVNGVRAGTAELTPGTSAYEHTVYAQAYDVTANL